MSVQNEISRISNAKDSIVEAIESHGVTVPSGTPIEGLAPLIRNLSTSPGEAFIPENVALLGEGELMLTDIEDAIIRRIQAVEGSLSSINQSIEEVAGLIPTVSDSYSAASSDAMSGKAVSNALSGIRQVPSFSASNDGMVLSVVSNNLVWVEVASVYSGSAAPVSTLGKDGDIYIQTS